MFRFSRAVFVVAVLSVAAQCNSAFGQYSSSGDPQPRSTSGGYAGNALRSIYREGIGTGYTGHTQNSLALQASRARIPDVGQSSFGQSSAFSSTAPRLDLGTSSQRLNKPFSSYTPGPTVSPYLNLFREDRGGNNDFDYQTLVRPQLQQQQLNQQLQRQSLELARRVQSIAAHSDYKNQAGSEEEYPTGHQTVFMYTGHYYPAEARQRKRHQ